MPVRSARRLALLVPALAAAALALPGGLAAPAAAQSLTREAADPTRAEATYDDARAHYDARLYPAAARAFGRFREAWPTHPRVPEALYYQAASALAAGDADGGASLFVRFQDLYPGHPLASEARLALGEFYYAQGRYDEAADALEATLQRPLPEADAARALYLLGQTRLRQDRPDEALAAFERLAAEYPAEPLAPGALYAAGALHTRLGDDARAAEAFERLATDYPAAPENATVGVGLMEAYARLGRYDDVAREAERRVPTLTGDAAARGRFLWGDALLRLGRPDEAAAQLEAVPSGTYDRSATFARARLAFDEGDFQAAAEAYASVRATAPPPGAGETGALAHEATYYEGVARKRLGQLGEAETLLEEAATTSGGAFADAALLEVGLLRYERRLYNEAAVAFERLLAEFPQSPYAGEAARMLGEAYAAQGDTRRAREAYRRAEQLGAASPELGVEVEFQDAYALYQSGDYDRAVGRLLAVAANDPTGPRAAEATFWAGEAAFQARDYGRAVQILTDYLRQFPTHRQADAGRYVLGWAHFQQRDYAAAALAFERFLSAYERGSGEAVPYYADALLRLGDSYYALRRYDEAAAVYARAQSATPDRRGADYALFQTGQTYAAAGRADDARAAFDRLLAEFPASPLRAEAVYAKGYLRFQAEDYDGAAALYEQVLRDFPASATAPRAQYALGDAHYNAGRYAEAEQAYRRVLDRYPDSPFVATALEGLGFTLSAQGREGELDAVVADFESRNPNPVTRARLRLRQAELALENGDPDRALTLAADVGARYGQVEEVAPDLLLLEYRALRETGRDAEADARYHTLLARYPDSAAAASARTDRERAPAAPANGETPADGAGTDKGAF